MKKYPSCRADIGYFCTKHGVIHQVRKKDIGCKNCKVQITYCKNCREKSRVYYEQLRER